MNKKWMPMLMDPVFKETVWGGTKIHSQFAKATTSEHTGESWEVAAHRHGQSRILTGCMAGKTLQEAMEMAPEAILGTAVYKEQKEKTALHFPLLIKLIDASDHLSVQVHPDDALAEQLEGVGETGKTEMWVVLDAEPGAKLIYGFQKEVKPEEFAQAIEEQRLEELVNWVPVKRGDAFFIPAGMLHAIGAGIVIAEIQQNSDTTYRVYDFGRLGLDGKPRELHVEKALQATRLTSSKGSEYADLQKGIDCPYFHTQQCQLNGQQYLDIDPARFEIVMVLEGAGTIDGLAFKKGDSFLLPAQTGRVTLDGTAVYLRIRP